MLLVAGAACRAPAVSRPAPSVLRLATAYTPLSEPLAAEYRRALPQLNIQPFVSAGSPDVIRGIETNAADMGVASADDVYEAYWTTTGVPSSNSHLRGVSLLQPLPAYLLVRGGSRITSITDLHDRVVATGPLRTMSSKLAMLVLDAFGVHGVTLKPYSVRTTAAADLKRGALDAIFLPGFLYPPDEVMTAVIREGAYIIPIEGPPVEKLRRENPFVRVVRVPRDIYAGQDRIFPTLGIDMVVVCREDLDESLVYALTAQLFEAFPRLSGVEANLRFLNLDEAPATPIPLHAGAARYFRERELSR